MTHDSRDDAIPGEGASAPAPAADKGPSHTASFRVLVPLDGSDLAAQALPVAASICAQVPGSELILMRALPPSPLAFGYVAVPEYIPPEVYQQMVDDQDQLGREYLESAAREASRRGAHVRAYLEQGNAPDVILDVAAREQVSLIVMTTHGRTGVTRFAVGSVADRVVRGGATPVLLLRSFQTQAWSDAAFRQVLIPMDGSTMSEAPLMGIVPQLAGTAIQQVTLLRVVDPRDGASAVSHAERYLAEVASRLRARLGDKACAIQTLVRSGPVVATILDCAGIGECGVVIMSTHGETGIGRLALGGVTDRILRDGQTPLLLVYPHEHTTAARAPSR